MEASIINSSNSGDRKTQPLMNDEIIIHQGMTSRSLRRYDEAMHQLRRGRAQQRVRRQVAHGHGAGREHRGSVELCLFEILQLTVSKLDYKPSDWDVCFKHLYD